MKKELLLLTVLILESIGATDELQSTGYYTVQMGRRVTLHELAQRVDGMKNEGLIRETDSGTLEDGEEYTLYEQTAKGAAWLKSNWA